MRRVRRAALSYFNEFDLTMSVFVDWNLGFRCYNVVLIHSMSISAPLEITLYPRLVRHDISAVREPL
jgi:hypothetical protein